MPMADKKITIRVTEDQRAEIARAAHRMGMNISRFMVAAALAGDQSAKQIGEVKALLREQTEAIAGGLERLAAEHDAHDAEVRGKLKIALENVHLKLDRLTPGSGAARDRTAQQAGGRQ